MVIFDSILKYTSEGNTRPPQGGVPLFMYRLYGTSRPRRTAPRPDMKGPSLKENHVLAQDDPM